MGSFITVDHDKGSYPFVRPKRPQDSFSDIFPKMKNQQGKLRAIIQALASGMTSKEVCDLCTTTPKTVAKAGRHMHKLGWDFKCACGRSLRDEHGHYIHFGRCKSRMQ